MRKDGPPRSTSSMPFRLLLTVALIGSLLACATSGAPKQRPADFSIRYKFGSGSVPPPGFYTFVLHVDPAGDETVELATDNGRALHNEKLAPERLDAIYSSLLTEGAFRDLADGRPAPEPVGSGWGGLTLTSSGRAYEIPETSADPAKALVIKAVTKEVESLVPPKVQKQLFQDVHDSVIGKG